MGKERLEDVKVSIPKKNRCNDPGVRKLRGQALGSVMGRIMFKIPQVPSMDRDDVLTRMRVHFAEIMVWKLHQ